MNYHPTSRLAYWIIHSPAGMSNRLYGQFLPWRWCECENWRVLPQLNSTYKLCETVLKDYGVSWNWKK